MFPLTLGANIGTTVTGLLASLVSDSVAALQVAPPVISQSRTRVKLNRVFFPR